MPDYLIWFDQLGMHDVARVGGKNASLGEMISNLAAKDVRVPGGFATTAEAYREFLARDRLDRRIEARLAATDISDMAALAESGQTIRQWIRETPFPAAFEKAVRAAFERLAREEGEDVSFAVRSSATAEDLPEASFAGQQETFLNIHGADALLSAIHEVFASLYNDRAIAYRVHQGFAHHDVALSAGVQRMVRSDLASSGVMFTLDTESGFDRVIFITAAWGLGETVVQGQVNPDEFYVHKDLLARGYHAILQRRLGEKAIRMEYGEARTPGKSVVTRQVSPEDQQRFSLNDDEVLELARQAAIIEDHYGKPMDIEWAKDGIDGKLYIVQARPETVKSRVSRNTLRRYHLDTDAASAEVLASGRSIGQRIGSGRARVIASVAQIGAVQDGDVLVTDMTDPDWEPVMKRAAAIVTDRGGRTCHAAIIARELGIPAVVGCGDATRTVPDGEDVTVSCAQGDAGFIYKGILPWEIEEIDPGAMPELPFRIMMNVATPDRAFDFRFLPNAGVGLARLEFIINRLIGIHPKALLNYDTQPDDVRERIDRQAAGYASPRRFFIDKLAEGIATIAGAFWPKPVIVRMSDFKSNEYANLIGGGAFEPHEENPMLGFRGASRYIAEDFRDCFELECLALRKVREEIGLENVEVMIPFVRTVDEARQVSELLAAQGLVRGKRNLRLIMMCEIPSNALLADDFLQYFDGFSIGSNDLTQLTLGLDRDSELVANLFDERNPAVKALLAMAIKACKQSGKYIGICGQGPSDHPDLARWLMEQGIDSVSLNPDSVIHTWLYLARKVASSE